MPMQLRGLRTFCVAAEHLSFKKAADELCLTASAVSHQISDLETQLGTKLFARLTRSVALTDEGGLLYDEVRPCLTTIDQAAQRIKKRATREPLLVQMPEFFASELLMPIINGFSDLHQDIDLRIESMDINSEIDSSADINIMLSRNRPTAPVYQKLFPIRYVPACSKQLHNEWLRKGFTGLDSINVATILLHKARPDAWRKWANFAGIPNMKPKQFIFVDSMFALARAAEQSVGIALVPLPVSQAWFDSGALVPLHNSHLTSEDFYWMTLNDKTKNPGTAQIFWDWISENLRRYG